MIVEHTSGLGPEAFVDCDVTRLASKSEMAQIVSENVAGVIVTGSPAYLRQGQDWMRWTMDALRELDHAQVPILGICFGHQLLGEAFGGRVDFNPRGREIGTYPLAFRASDTLLGAPGDEPVVVMTHLDSVVVAPPGSTVIASTALETNAAIRFSDTTWGVQFHPEMDAEIVGYYIGERRDIIAAEGIDVDLVESRLRDDDYGVRLLSAFARFCLERG